MKEIICTTQKELDAAVKEKNCYIVIRDTKEWVSVSGNAIIQAISGNATITSVSGNATIKSVSDNATIQYVSGNATIKYVYGYAIIQVFSPSVTILYTAMYAVIIMIGCVCKIKKRQKSVTVIKNKIAEYTKRDFLGIYSADKNGDITLYKSVQDNNTDFYTSKIKYEGTVTCPDWDSDKHRQCGGGLHLSPRPELALIYNQGKLLKCKVNKKDFVVFPDDITKVRCKKVTVIGEYTEGK